MSKKLIVIDGNSIANRAFYALPMLNNAQGLPTNAVYGFTTMLLRLIDEEQPSHILVAFDAGKANFRHAEYKEYKGHRDKTPSELSQQFPLLRRLLDAFSIKHYELEGYEADDIIGTLTKVADGSDIHTKVVTGDKDMLQLISQHVQVTLTRKGISEVDAYDLDKLQEVYQLKPEQIIDLKGLMGDASDNIPGVPGVGEKTALKLLHQYGSVEAVYEHLDEVSGKKLKENLEENEEQAMLSKKLATILREAPLELGIEETAYQGFEKSKVVDLFKELEFNSLLEKLTDGTDEVEAQEALEYKLLSEADSPLFEEALLEDAALYVEILEDHYRRADVLGLAICHDQGLYYLPVEVALKSEAFQEWLADKKKQKVMVDGKKAEVNLWWRKLKLTGIRFDIQLVTYLLNPGENNMTLDRAAKLYAEESLLADEQVYGKGAKFKIPEQDVLMAHITRKAYVSWRLFKPLEEALEKADMHALFYDLELPLSRILAQMEMRGITINRPFIDKMGEELLRKLEQLTKEIYELAGTEFNINSPKQLGEILFDKLGLPVIKKTKTGYSTNAEVLEALEPQHEVISKLLLYRQLGKLQSTYIEGLSKEIDEETGKIHTAMQQTIAATGRISSNYPNLQNIPIRLEEGRKLRQAFVPTEANRVILAADYSQIELRVMAHLSKDEGLKTAFLENKDIHTQTAMDVFHVAEDEVTSVMRRQAKAVNFGIIYGISDYGLSQNLHITRKEAKAFIERYFASYPGVRHYMEAIVVEARKQGFVSTLLQRRRYLPEINSRNFNIRSFAERTAINTPIQGSAADIIKKAMIDIEQLLTEKKLTSTLLLQVHDELVFEVPADELEEMQKLVPKVMEQAISLDVPLKVDVSYGKTWYEAK